MTELLWQVTERGASGSPELNLGQSCWGDPFALELFINCILDCGDPRLHGWKVFIHEIQVFAVCLDGGSEGGNGEVDWDSARYLDGGVLDLRHKLFDVFPGLGIFGLKGKVNILK